MSIQYNLYVYTVKNHCTSNPVVQAQYISSWLNSNEALKYDRPNIVARGGRKAIEHFISEPH